MRRMGPLLLVALVACAHPSPPLEVRARAVEAQVWSPYCPGRLLADCTTAQARELRGRIEARLRAGQSEAEVLSWLRQNYGDEILARPGPGGGWVWAVPATLLAAGGALVAGLVRRWRAPPGSLR